MATKLKPDPQNRQAVTVHSVNFLATNKASQEETLEHLLEAPRMRQHLSALVRVSDPIRRSPVLVNDGGYEYSRESVIDFTDMYAPLLLI